MELYLTGPIEPIPDKDVEDLLCTGKIELFNLLFSDEYRELVDDYLRFEDEPIELSSMDNVNTKDNQLKLKKLRL